MMRFYIIYLLSLITTIQTINNQTVKCSCHFDSTEMTMICENIHSVVLYQRCFHEQLHLQTDSRLKRGHTIKNLTIKHHQLRNLSNGLFHFSYGNAIYQLNDLRYLHIIHGTLKHIDDQALILIQATLEHLDLSYNQLHRIPTFSTTRLLKLILPHNHIYHLSVSDIEMYKQINVLDLSFNRLQYVDMNIMKYLIDLEKLYLNSNMLRTLTNNITFPNNFHLKLNPNPLECDCRLRWLRNSLNRVEYPVYHDEPKCEIPKALADKNIVTLRDEQFVCGPIISKPDSTVLIANTGEIAILRCDVYSDPAPEVWWTFQNKIIGKIMSNNNESDVHTGSYIIRYACASNSFCLNKTVTLTISNIDIEHNGTYNCVAAIRNQGRSDNEHLSYELHIQRVSSFSDNSILFWIICIALFLSLILFILLCSCITMYCKRTNQSEKDNMKEKINETYNPYNILDSKSQLGPPMYNSLNSPRSIRSDRQIYEQIQRSIPIEQIIVDEFEDEMIFPTGYEEDYQYREDIIKPNQSIDPRRETNVQHTNHDRSNGEA